MLDVTIPAVELNAWPRSAILAILLACWLSLSPCLLAQQAAQPQVPTSVQSRSQRADAPVTASSQPTPAPSVPKDDRILWTLPNYLTVEHASSLASLTPGGKFKLIAKDT